MACTDAQRFNTKEFLADVNGDLGALGPFFKNTEPTQ
jgi:hypothetical protein